MVAEAKQDRWDPRTVGIALAAYQPNPAWLAEQLGSIVAQTHREWICVITLDSPIEEIRSAPELDPFMHDIRFTWIENPERLGLKSNFQKATRLLLERNVDLIAFSDQDDIWLPAKLAESVAAIRDSGPLSMVYCDAHLLVNGEIRQERLHRHTLKTRGDMSLAERIIQPQVSGFCEVFDANLARLHPSIPGAFPVHDHWYTMVAAAYGGVHRIDAPLALYRQHAGNAVGITSVRNEQGWEKAVHLSNYVGLRANAHYGASLADSVGRELPIGHGLRLLFGSKPGWLLVLVGIMGRRVFTSRPLASNAYRKAWGLLLMQRSRREEMLRVRSRFPVRWPLVRVALVLSIVLPALLTLAWSQSGASGLGEQYAVGSTILLVAAAAITGFRYVQHQMPNTTMLLIGIGAAVGLLLQQVGVGIVPALAVASVPILANVLYRLRWALRP